MPSVTTTRRIMPPQLRSRHGDKIVTTFDVKRDGTIHSENVTISVPEIKETKPDE